MLIGNYRRVEITVEPLAGDGPARFTLVSDKHAPDGAVGYYMRLLIEGAETHGLPGMDRELRAVPTRVEHRGDARRSVIDAGLAVMRKLRADRLMSSVRASVDLALKKVPVFRFTPAEKLASQQTPLPA